MGVSAPPADLPTGAYATVEVIPHRLIRRNKRGPQVPADWPQQYLAHLAKHATQWMAARSAGVSVRSVERLRALDPTFAEHERDAIREHAEHLEQRLDTIANGDGMPAVTAAFGRLKKLLPLDYVERNQTLLVNVNTELTPADGRALLQAMLQDTRPATRQALQALPPASEPS